MPMHEVTVRRWEVLIAFVAITVAFVAGLWTINHRVSKKEFSSASRIHHVQDCERARALLDYLDARQKQVPLDADSRAHYIRYRNLVLSDC